MRSAYSPTFSTSAIRSPQRSASRWNVELLLRYAAATATTWIALAGAQLIVPTNFAVILAVLAALGVPVSLYLRFSDMKVGSIVVPRPLWNSLTVIGTLIIGSFFLWPTIDQMVMMWNTEPASFWLRFGAGDSLGLLMQAFLVFAALRSFAIISDKDATLTTIPSFSVLLLLIPVHKGIEVVCYFLAWTFVATILFALDHRSELSAGVVGRVPSPVPGQDVRLAARSLITVLGVSLTAAIGISMYLTSRNPEERSEAETAITSLAARLTQFALSLPDGSVNSGPERQIDFSSGPNLPSRAELWRGQALTISNRSLHPAYWRLFSLSNYNGSSWSQTTGRQRSVKVKFIDWIPSNFFGISFFGGGQQGQGNPFGSNLSPGFFPRDNNQPGGANGPTPGLASPSGGPGQNGGPIPDATRQAQQFRGNPQQFSPSFSPFFPPDNPGIPVKNHPGVFAFKRPGFNLRAVSSSTQQYGNSSANSSMLVRVMMTAQNANLGFVPMLPAPDSMAMGRDQTQNEVRVSFDGAVDTGVMQAGQRAMFTAHVPHLADYGFRSGSPPLIAVKATKNTLRLDPNEHAINLKLPPTVTQRTRDLGARLLLRSPKEESNYSRALRLAQAIQHNAVYTLRPPSIPDGRDATDFFLFDGAKRGYCTYFAGALTVLCRTQNIPARVVSGFASPDYSSSGEAIIRDANAHAWTEVWVDNWGWAIVDATPADDRGDNAPTWIESWGDWFGATLDSLSRSATSQWPLLAVAVVGSLLLIVRWNRQRLWRGPRRSSQHPELLRREIIGQYDRMSRLLARHFRPRASWETPDEWVAAAQAALPHLPLAALRQVTQLYLQAQFSPTPLAADTLDQAYNAVQSVRDFSWRQKITAQSPAQI